MIENLENRTLFAATAVLADGVLAITGTPANDNINMSISPAGVLKATLNGVDHFFPASKVQKIQVKLLDGDDLMVANHTVYQGITAWGGNGHDTMFGGRGHDRMWGENGMDKIFGNDGMDYLNGGADSDGLYGGNHNDILVAGTGRDRCDGGAGADHVTTNGDGARDEIKFDAADTVVKDWFDVFY